MASQQECTLRMLAIPIFVLLLLPGTLWGQDNGTIEGQVLDAEGNHLTGARVTVVGTTLRTSTGPRGIYRLSPVPAGTHKLIFNFLGFSPETVEVEVEAGAVLTQNVSLIPFMEEITVTASPLLMGQAKALNRQKNAINITNVVASDQIGRFPDKNAAEATQRIPAITLQRDMGEGRYVLVRGTEARLNSTTINGERIPSPEAGTRDIALDVIPADLLDSIQVSKALTPDMDGDAIGGTVDLVTRLAPEVMRVSGRLSSSYSDLMEDTGPNAGFTWGDRFNDKQSGLILSGSANVTNRGADNFEVEYDDGDLDEFQLRDYTTERKRYGVTGAWDHLASEQSNFWVRGLWNNYQDTELRRAKTEVVGDNEIERAVKDRLQESFIYSLTGGGSHSIGESLVIDYRAAWNRAQEETPDQVTAGFIQEDVEFDPNVSADFIDPNNIRSNPLNEDINEFYFDELENEYKLSEEEDLVGKVDFTYGFIRDDGFSGLWKAGVKARLKSKDQDVTVFAYESEDDILLTQMLSDWKSETAFLGGRYDIGQFHDPKAMRDLLASGALEGERNLEEDLADFTSEEDTFAAYGLTELEFGAATTFLGGLRVEMTETDYRAFELVFDEEGDPADLTPVTGGTDYTEWLPMLHLKQRLSDKSNLRAAVTRTLARPNFEDLAPFQVTNYEDEEIVRGNPDLNVTTSWNADLLWEHFLEPLGVVSAGIFYKRLDDIIYLSTHEEEIDGNTFDVEQPVNGEQAKILGIEVAYQNRFAGLPSPWDGLGLFFNYTYSDSEASYPDRPDTNLQGQAENVGNLALSYEKFGFTGRISVNHNSEYILAVGEEPAEDVWIDEHTQFDFSARQQIGPRWSVFLEVINLTDEPFRVYEGTPDRPIQEEYYGWWGVLGLRFDW